MAISNHIKPIFVFLSSLPIKTTISDQLREREREFLVAAIVLGEQRTKLVSVLRGLSEARSCIGIKSKEDHW